MSFSIKNPTPMKFLLLMSFLSLSGCENTKELHYGNVRAYFWPDIDKNSSCMHMVFGVPGFPYRPDQDIKIIYRDKINVSLTQKNLLEVLEDKYGKPSKYSLNGKKGPSRYPGKSFTYPDNLIKFDFGKVDLIFKDKEIWSIQISCITNRLIRKKSGEEVKVDLVDSKFIEALSINGKLIEFPLKEVDLTEVLGNPDKESKYFSE